MAYNRFITLITILIGFYLFFQSPSLSPSPSGNASVTFFPPNLMTVTAAVPRYFPPSYSVDNQGNPQGFAIDVIEAVAKRANVRIKYEIKDTWQQAIAALKKGEVDFIPNLAITETRSQWFQYTTPIETLNIALFVLRDSNLINLQTDFSGRKIAVIQGNAAINLLKNDENVTLKIVDSPEEALFYLLSGEVDALAYPEAPIQKLAQSISIEYRLKVLKYFPEAIPIAIAICKNNVELLQRFQEALIQFKGTPDYQEIHQRWHQPDSVITLSPQFINGILLASCLVIIGFIVWRYYILRSLERLRKTQIALKESEAQYRAIVEDQTELICRFLPDGTLTFVNQAYCRYFSQRYEDIINSCLFSIIPVAHQTCVQNQLRQLSLDNLVVSYQHPVINGQGEMRWQYWTNRGLFDEMGELTEIQAVGRDITEQKLIEEKLSRNLRQSQILNEIIQQIHQSLDLDILFRDTLAKMRNILESDRLALYKFNQDGSGEFIAESVAKKWVKLVGKELKKVWEDTYLQKIQRGSYQNNEPFKVNDIYTVGHQPCHIDFLEQFQARAYIIAPIFVRNQLWGFLACYQNSCSRHWKSSEIKLLKQISEQLGLAIQQSQLLTELAKAKDSAESASQAKSNFLAHMSHELRTPLNAILGFTQLLSNDDNLQIEQKQYIEIVNQSGEHLLSLIQSILDMAKIESGQTNLNVQAFNIHKLVKKLMRMFKLKANNKQIDLKLELEDKVPEYIVSDEGKLRQILINLLNNAIKFTNKKEVILRVKVNEQVKQDNDNFIPLLFEIEDQGPGIDIEEVQYLFKPFYQTELGRRSQEGTGLGLTISQEFVNLMGGTLQVSCTLKGGTIFHFTLSLEIAKNSNLDHDVAHHPKIIGLAPNQPKYRILIVEDNATNRKLLNNLLEPIGFQIKESTNGQEGVKIWETWQPDLIWMDLQMPVMNGYQATKYIRARMTKLNIKKPTKIIALTANVLTEDRNSILEMGCDDFVSKPVSESLIFEKLSQHLGVTYIYDNSLTSKSLKNRPQHHDLDDLKTEIQTISSSLRTQLHQQAAAADGEAILELLHDLSPKHTDLCQAITDLVNNYNFDQIMEITQ
ncbi:MAG: transporter substrate-binding domain-containing protein [Crocosphaera sp.]|nr:transporter substrate-binding domain-containing protein [Crocosphaera sp.]